MDILNGPTPIRRAGAQVPASRADRFLGRLVRPCRMIAPTVEQIAESTRDAQSRQDERRREHETPGTYGIRGIPTLLLFKGGNSKRPW